MMENEISKSQKHDQQYQELISDIGGLLANARQHIASSVNIILVETYWQIGRYIVEYEQKGAERAEYGSNLLNRLSNDLTLKYGKGFGKSNLLYMRKLYITFPKSGTLSHLLSWSHYYEILKCYCLIDLNRGEVQHEDIGQMNFYLNYFKKEVCTDDDNEPIGIILGANADKLTMEYAMNNISNQLFVSRYQLYLPDRDLLEAQLKRLLENEQCTIDNEQ